MPDILLDTSAVFSVDAVFVPAKVNATPRIGADSWRYATAQHATVGDDSVIALNSWLQGDSPAGATGKNITTLGGVSIAEKSGVSGGVPGDVTGADGLSVGSVASVITSLNIQSSAASSCEILFGDAGAANAGGLVYDHAADSLTLSTATVPRFVLDATGIMPSAHVTYDFGADLTRWNKLWSDKLDVKSSAYFGNGATAFDLAIDGGAGVGQEPRVRFCQVGVPVAGFRLLSGGDLQIQNSGAFDVATDDALIVPRMDTTARNLLADVAGKVVYDTTIKAAFVNDGTVWNQIASNASGMEPISLTRSTSVLPVGLPAVHGELGGGQPVLEFADALTLSAFWYVQIPSGYAGGDLNVKLWWAGLLGSASNVAWQWGFERFQDLDNLNVNGSNFPALSLHAGDLISQRLNSFTRVFTNADMDSIQAGDMMRLTLRRVGADAGDLYGGSMTVLGMQITQ